MFFIKTLNIMVALIVLHVMFININILALNYSFISFNVYCLLLIFAIMMVNYLYRKFTDA
jgi:hypothetical protein